MESCDNLYEVLGVSRSVGFEELKKGYHQKLLKYSPDKICHTANDEELKKATQLYLRLHDAWEILSDPVKKRQYDAKLAAERLKYETPQENGVELAEMDYDSDEDVYYYECRCGGYFQFSIQSHSGNITCDTCSLSMCVTTHDDLKAGHLNVKES